MTVKRVCVFCGSSRGMKQEYVQDAKQLGKIIAQKDMVLVYGGVNIGIMGQLAKSCIESGGETIGIIDRDTLNKGIAFTEQEQLHIVNSMHERNQKMVDTSDFFIALPGGFETVEEFFDVLLRAESEMHQKSFGILNTCGYYDKLIEFFDYSVEQQFLESDYKNVIQIDENPEELFYKMESYIPAKTEIPELVKELMKRMA